MEIIKLTQGDDSNALGGKIIITLQSETDLVGYTAKFRLGAFLQTFDDITSGELSIVIPAEESAKLPAGLLSGSLKIFDADGFQKTVLRNIMFQIEPGVQA